MRTVCKRKKKVCIIYKRTRCLCSQTARESQTRTSTLYRGSGWNIHRTKQKRRRRRRRIRRIKGSKKKDYGQYTWVSHRNVIGFLRHICECVCVELCWNGESLFSWLLGVRGLSLLYFILTLSAWLSLSLSLSPYRRILMNCSDTLKEGGIHSTRGAFNRSSNSTVGERKRRK